MLCLWLCYVWFCCVWLRYFVIRYVMSCFVILWYFMFFHVILWQGKATEPQKAAAGIQAKQSRVLSQEGELELGAAVPTTHKQTRRRRRGRGCNRGIIFQSMTPADDKHPFGLPKLAPPRCFWASDAGKGLSCLPCACIAAARLEPFRAPAVLPKQETLGKRSPDKGLCSVPQRTRRHPRRPPLGPALGV